MFSTNKIKYKMILQSQEKPETDSKKEKDGKKVINQKVSSKIQQTIQINDSLDFSFLIKIDDYNIDCTIQKQSLNNLV